MCLTKHQMLYRASLGHKTCSMQFTVKRLPRISRMVNLMRITIH
ncbi:hypothetical protein E2C01_081400 [Portunus trituberculatus]|uniref:Uncharacterized protein n=1 Tax=Portunus trituberculatus TaxID=210409 RepID=A0A5B7IYQ4_PORTR|nr:hypothetical protein [Portunus trituberculatus]